MRATLEKDLDSLRSEKKKLTEECHGLRLDTESKDSKIRSLTAEVAELEGNTAVEEELRRVKRQKADLEQRLKDQSDETEDLVCRVQELEATRARLEAAAVQAGKERERELSNKEEEIEDVKAAAGKKLKVLEQQLEQEQEERVQWMRERHELDARLAELQEELEQTAAEEGVVARLKKDLKRTKALLRDAHQAVETQQTDETSGVIMRQVLNFDPFHPPAAVLQLKQQLEEAECGRAAAVKQKQARERELADTQAELDEATRGRKTAEEQSKKLNREKGELAAQLEEGEVGTVFSTLHCSCTADRAVRAAEEIQGQRVRGLGQPTHDTGPGCPVGREQGGAGQTEGTGRGGD